MKTDKNVHAISLRADERAQVAFTDLVPIGILNRESLSGVVPMLVVNSLLVPSVLPTPRASENSLKLSAHFDVS